MLPTTFDGFLVWLFGALAWLISGFIIAKVEAVGELDDFPKIVIGAVFAAIGALFTYLIVIYVNKLPFDTSQYYDYVLKVFATEQAAFLLTKKGFKWPGVSNRVMEAH